MLSNPFVFAISNPGVDDLGEACAFLVRCDVEDEFSRPIWMLNFFTEKKVSWTSMHTKAYSWIPGIQYHQIEARWRFCTSDTLRDYRAKISIESSDMEGHLRIF